VGMHSPGVHTHFIQADAIPRSADESGVIQPAFS
jgi:hypothetical protein